MVSDLDIEKENKWNEVNPNFINNRFDLANPQEALLLKYIVNDKEFIIPIKIKSFTIDIGIYLTKLSQEEFENLIKLVFKKFKSINRLRISSSLNNYFINSQLQKNIDYVTILPNTVEEFFSNLSSQSRYNLKRKAKKLYNDFADIKIKKYTDNIPDFIFKKYFEYKRVTHHKNYFMTIEDYKKRYHVTDVYVMFINNEIQAIVLNSVINCYAYLENVTYNTDFGKYSLGILLMYEMIKDCIEKKIKYIYWGYGNDYKKHFSNYSPITYSGYIYRYNWQLYLKLFLKSINKTGKQICGFFHHKSA